MAKLWAIIVFFDSECTSVLHDVSQKHSAFVLLQLW